MTIIRVGADAPIFRVESSDISGNTFVGAKSFLGASVYNITTGLWYTIDSAGLLQPYTVPVSFSGTLTTQPVRSLTATPTVTPPLSVAATYVTGDYVGQSAAPMTFSNCAAAAGTGGFVTGALLIDAAKQSIAAELWIFDTSALTIPADSAPWDITDDDAKHLVCVIPFSTYYASVSNSVSIGVPPANTRFQCGAALRELYGCLVTRGAPTYATGNLTVRLSVLQD